MPIMSSTFLKWLCKRQKDWNINLVFLKIEDSRQVLSLLKVKIQEIWNNNISEAERSIKCDFYCSPGAKDLTMKEFIYEGFIID